MHQPQKKTDIPHPGNADSGFFAEICRDSFGTSSTELGSVRHTTPTNGMYNVGVFDSIIEGGTYGAQCAP